MKRFIVIYHSPQDAVEQMMQATPEEQAKGMEVWMQWAERMGDNLIDLGTPLTSGQSLKPDGSDRPSGSDIAGYSILQAESMEEAVKLLQGHPHLGWNAACTIDVHETMELVLEGGNSSDH